MSLTNLTDLSGTPRNCLQTFSMLAPSSVTLLWMIEWTLNRNQTLAIIYTLSRIERFNVLKVELSTDLVLNLVESTNHPTVLVIINVVTHRGTIHGSFRRHALYT